MRQDGYWASWGYTGSQSAKCHTLLTRPPSEDVRQHSGIVSELPTIRSEPSARVIKAAALVKC
jgi:hypothetical protein